MSVETSEPVFITAILLNEDFDVITDVLLYVVEALNEEATRDVLNVFRHPAASGELEATSNVEDDVFGVDNVLATTKNVVVLIILQPSKPPIVVTQFLIACTITVTGGGAIEGEEGLGLITTTSKKRTRSFRRILNVKCLD
jgi:hypothetical protein